MIALVAATERGRELARHLESVLPDASLLDGRPSEAFPRAFEAADAVVAFLATGATIRLVAPLLVDKRTDPGVVCVDDGSNFAVALLGGHQGGANELARRVADALGAVPVVTTASDSSDLPGLDSFGRDLGFKIEDDAELATVAAAMIGGRPVQLLTDQRWPLGPLPTNIVESVLGGADPALPTIVVTDRLVDPPQIAVVYRPPSLVVGVGCSRGAAAAEIVELIERACAEQSLALTSVAGLASADVKSDEDGLLAAAKQLDLSLTFFNADQLAAVATPNPSVVVEQAVGTPSVCEAAALLMAGWQPGSEHKPELIVEKTKSAMATVAIARKPVRGRLALIGLGPGDDSLLPPMARDALGSANTVIGLKRYVESIQHLLKPGTQIETYDLGEEIDRCRRAAELARTGLSVALVSSGDIGVYAMASPALEEVGDEIDVRVVPGVTAASAASALLGSPLGHDHCSISLSDLMTPWEMIVDRLEAAAAADFVISFYNPRSRTRQRQFDQAVEILLAHRSPDTPVGIVTDAYRETQSVLITTLGELDPETVSMTTLVTVGNSQTRLIGGRMVTPRGYVEAGVAAR